MYKIIKIQTIINGQKIPYGVPVQLKAEGIHYNNTIIPWEIDGEPACIEWEAVVEEKPVYKYLVNTVMGFIWCYLYRFVTPIIAEAGYPIAAIATGIFSWVSLAVGTASAIIALFKIVKAIKNK